MKYYRTASLEVEGVWALPERRVSEGADLPHVGIVWGMLAKLLPVLNGMVYSDSSERDAAWARSSCVAPWMTRSHRFELRVVTAYTWPI